jgi:hypothetical protein
MTYSGTSLPFNSIYLTAQIKRLLKMAVLWDIAPSNLVEVDGRLWSADCLHHHYRPHYEERNNL